MAVYRERKRKNRKTVKHAMVNDSHYMPAFSRGFIQTAMHQNSNVQRPSRDLTENGELFVLFLIITFQYTPPINDPLLALVLQCSWCPLDDVVFQHKPAIQLT